MKRPLSRREIARRMRGRVSRQRLAQGDETPRERVTSKSIVIVSPKTMTARGTVQISVRARHDVPIPCAVISGAMENVREIGRVTLILWIEGGRASRATFLHRVRQLGLSALPADCRGSDLDKGSFLSKEERAKGGGRVFPQCQFARERPRTDCAERPGQGTCCQLGHKLVWPMLAYSIGYSDEDSARALCLHSTVKEAQIGKNGRIVRGGFLAPALGMGPEKIRPPQPREVKRVPVWHELPDEDKGRLAVEPSAAAFIARLIEEKEI